MVVKWKDKKVLITGIGGFIGGSIAMDLIKQGAMVDGIDDLSVGKEETIPEGCSYRSGKVTPYYLNLLDKNYDIVFHFAAPCTIIQYKDDPLGALAKANEAAYSIRQFCKENKIPYLVYASSATWYGSSTEDWDWEHHDIQKWGYQEELPPSPDNLYAVSKCTEECMDGLFPEVKTLALRIFPAFGAREKIKGKYSSVPYQVVNEMRNGRRFEIWGDGEQQRDFIYIHDLVYCIRTLVERGATGAYNLGTGSVISTNDLVNAVNEVLGTKIEAKYVPVPNYKYTKVLKSDPSKLLSVIGDFKFTSLVDAVKDMLEEI